ncbi:telomere repeats-binding bouquet formation protein 1-like isoform X3 [Crassostrea virginica]
MDKRHQENAEVQTDVKLLLECLKCQVSNPTALKQALLTLSNILSSYEFVQEYFKDSGGLLFLIDLLTSVDNCEVQERTLFCLGCAIERNVFCQKSLTSINIFKFIQTILSRGSTAKLKQTATFFLINLVSNNGEGQVLVKQSQCLSTLMELLSFSLPRNMTGTDANDTDFDWFDGRGPTSLELWTSVVNAICVSINNPQNDENQRMCGLQLPFIMSLFEKHRDEPLLGRPLMFLLVFVVSNNSTNQNHVRRSGGLKILCMTLKQWYEKFTDSELMKDVVHIITTIDSCIADNADSADELGRMGIIDILVNVIHNEHLNTEDKIKVTITLGHAIENSVSNRKLFLKVRNSLQDIVQILTTSEDEELVKAVKYVLQISVQKDPGYNKEWQQEIPENKDIGENILKKMNDLARRLSTVEKETESRIDFISAAEINTSTCFEKISNIDFLNPGLSKEIGKKCGNILPVDECFPKYQQEICQNQSCNANAGGGMEVHPETVDSHGVNVNIEQRGCVLHEQMENQNTGHPSPNSSTKSFDVDLTKIIPQKEYDHIHRSKTVSHENFKVPACPPCKIRTTSKKPFKPAEHCISDVETEPGFSDIQSEFDWNLLSGAAYERDARITPSRGISVTPIKNSKQHLYKTPVHHASHHKMKMSRHTYYHNERTGLQTPRFSVKPVESGKTTSLSDKSEGIHCRRRILDVKESGEIMSCIGCTGISCTSDETQLNSRTINIVLETNPYTCMLHRQVRDVERSYIQKIKRQRRAVPIYSRQQTFTPNNSMTYEFTSESEPEVSAPDTIDKKSSGLLPTKLERKRRHRVPYSEQEIQNLMEGVRSLGKFWGQILATYDFHPSRTAVDLMEKFKRLTKATNSNKTSGTVKTVPFSMCEERRLLKGVHQFGYSWKTILHSFKFSNGRTAEDLRNRWRCMNG